MEAGRSTWDLFRSPLPKTLSRHLYGPQR
jgi:hypothetical protein